ncbi:MAG: hypothetical protein NWR86_00055 [Schleiferiaceae bacterium]|nr:hypothetical protein [Schleiferiaceae bacterium]
MKIPTFVTDFELNSPKKTKQKMKKVAFFMSAFALVALVACNGAEETANDEMGVDTLVDATVDTAAAAADTAAAAE